MEVPDTTQNNARNSNKQYENVNELQSEKKEPEKYSYEYCRENLKAGYYTDWNCHDISKQLKDNWVKDDVEYLMRNGLSFEYAIDEMMEEGKIKL